MADRGNGGFGDGPFGRPFGAPRDPSDADTGPIHGLGNGRTNGTNGSGRPHGVPNRPIPFPVGGRGGMARDDLDEEFSDEPLDLVAVQADDELINALSAGMTVSSPGRGGYDADDRVVAMLAAWKAEVDAEPIPQLVDLDTAVAAVDSGTVRKRPSSRRRHLVPLAGAAALIVFSIAGVSLGAQQANPGDALFPVTQVLYKDAANSKIAANEVTQRIQQVNTKLATGDTTGAQQELAAMAPLLAQVRPEEGKTYLAAQQGFLTQKAQETPPGQPVDPQAPLRDGTPPPTPPKPEGAKDPQAPVVPPASSSSPKPAPAPASPQPGPGTPGPGTTDPKVQKQDGTGGTTSAPPSSSAKPPVPEGSKDPTTPTTTTPVPPGTTTSSLGATTSPTATESAGATS